MGERRASDGLHARVRGLLGPYVLGALEPGEERLVEGHLVGCATCRDEERGLRKTHERLAGASIAAAAAPADLKDRVLGARGERGPTPGARRPVVLAAAAMLLLLLGLAGVVYAAELLGPGTTTASLSATELAPRAGGELEVRDSDGFAEASLEVWGLPETGPDEYYELWFGKGEGRVSAGSFTVDAEGRGEIFALCPEVAGSYERAGITLEKFPEEPSIDAAAVVLRADL